MVEERQERAAVPAGAGPLNGRVWVTRQGDYEDRIASAWLIHRFVNPRFKFVPTKGDTPEPDKLRLGPSEGEHTHKGEHCTFEVLLARMGLDRPALAAIGKIVHGIDPKGGKFGREEATGIAHLMEGIATTNK